MPGLHPTVLVPATIKLIKSYLIAIGGKLALEYVIDDQRTLNA